MVSSFHFLTAAHCVYDAHHGYINSATIYLGQNGENYRPYGVALGTFRRIHTAYRPGYSDYDFGLITLDRQVGNLTSWLGQQYEPDNWYRGVLLNSAGYPANLSDGHHMYYTYGQAQGVSGYDTIVFPQNGSFEASSGQSGSAVWAYYSSTGQSLIHGVVSGIGNGTYNVARMTESIFNGLQTAINEDSHGRSSGDHSRYAIRGGDNNGTPPNLPDLTDYDQWFHTSVSSFSQGQFRPGDFLGISSRVYNAGLAAANNVTVAFYATTNPSNPRSGYLLGRSTIQSVASMGWADDWWSGSLPTIPAGQYYVSWVIDPDNAVAQYNSVSHSGYIANRLLTVLPTYQPPVAGDGAYAVDQDTTLRIAAPGVLANGRDPNGLSLRAALVSSVQHGTLTLNADGSFVYTPAAGFYGTDAFRYQASDGIGSSNIATVTLTVRQVLHPPIAVDASYAEDEDNTLSVAAPGVLANARDPDGRSLHAVLVSGVQHGTLTLNADGSFRYVPNTHFFGTDTFTYQANDGILGSNVATVTLTVNFVPQPTTTFLASRLSSAILGQPIALTANVVAPGGGSPTGTVTFVDGGITIGTTNVTDGLAFYVATLGLGLHTLTALYNGDTVFSGSTSASVNVSVFAPQPSTTVLASSVHSATVGRSINLTANVIGAGGGSPNGTITFLDGSSPICTANLVNNAASCPVTLSQGQHALSARYSGDGAFTGSTSAALNVSFYNSAFFAVGLSNGHVQVRRAADGALVADFAPYGPGYNGPVSVALGDVNGDGYEDLVTGAMAGNPDVRVYNGKDIAQGTFNPATSLLAHWFPYALQYNVGANVAVGDVSGNGFADIVTGATAGNPDVHVYSGKDIAQGTFNPAGTSLLAQWFAYGLQFNVGANVAVGDVEGDGFADIVTGATVGNPDVRVYSGSDIAHGTFNPAGASLIAHWFAYGLQYNVGAFVAVGDINGDGFADVITGASSGNPQVNVYDGQAIAGRTLNPSTAAAHLLDQFYAYPLGQGLGVTVGAANAENTGRWNILAGTTKGTPTFRILRTTSSGVSPSAVFEDYLPDLPAGVSVSA